MYTSIHVIYTHSPIPLVPKKKVSRNKGKVEFGVFPTVHGVELAPLNDFSYEQVEQDEQLQTFMDNFGKGQEAENDLDLEQDQNQGVNEVDEYGMPKDGYDYSQHLAPIRGLGKFVTNTGEVSSCRLVVVCMNPSIRNNFVSLLRRGHRKKHTQPQTNSLGNPSSQCERKDCAITDRLGRSLRRTQGGIGIHDPTP